MRFKAGFRGLVSALALIALAPFAIAQVAPTNPVYIPTLLTPPQTILAAAAPTTVSFQTNGAATLLIRIAGTNTGLAATIQGTEARGGTPVWTTLGVEQSGTGSAGRISAITADGLYKVAVGGYAQIRVNISALSTGSVLISSAQGPGASFVTQLPSQRSTYSAAALIATGATNHFLVISGSATKTVRITHVECSGKATAAIAVTVTAEMTSAADTGDAGTALTDVPLDSNDPAATAVVLSHTTSPTPGALIGLVRAGGMALANASTPVFQPSPLSWDFGGKRPGAQEVVLHGVAQSFALNTNAAFGTAAAVGCAIEWSEE